MERAKRFLQGRRGRLFMAAGGMALIVSAVYAACGFWPFGPNSVMTGDLNSQYIPFYAHFYDAVREGGSLFYADDLGLGGGAFALFAYYFASPFAGSTLSSRRNSTASCAASFTRPRSFWRRRPSAFILSGAGAAKTEKPSGYPCAGATA